MRIEQKEYKGIRYLLYYPKDYKEGQKYPVLFHLHGAGGRGTDFSLFNDSTVLAVIQDNNSPLRNGFCVVPQCHTDTWFDIFNDVLDLVKFFYNQEWTDKTKFNGSGISMGGYGIYQVMMCLPELFNKALVCCGGGMYWNAGRMKNIKFRIFHGEDDGAVFPEESKRMYDSLKWSGADVEFELLKNTDHNCWDYAFKNYDNLKWLFE